jgi:anti-anti-sigma regulatory factor
MELVESEMDGVVIVWGRIDRVGAKPFGDRLVQLIHAGSHHVLIDLQDIVYMSSAGTR